MLMFGDYYAYDIPAATVKQFQVHLDMSEDDFNYLLNNFYTTYSFPNIILPIFFGLLMDRYGVHRILLMLAICIIIGQVLFSLGVSYKQISLLYLGRMLFGIGGESIGVAQSRFTAKWFGGEVVEEKQQETELLSSTEEANQNEKTSKPKQLALAMGLNLAVGRFGSVINDFVSPRLAMAFSSPSEGVILAVWVGMLMCLLSSICAFLVIYLDKKHSKTISRSSKSHDHLVQESEWQKIFRLPFSFWLICFIMILSYGTVIPFNTIHSAFLQRRFLMDPVSSAQIMAIPDTISMILTPFAGTFADYFGHRVHTLGLCSMILGVIHLSLGIAQKSSLFMPVVPLILMGFCYACLLLFWPMMPLILPKSILATAFGIGSALLNLSLTIFPLLTAEIIHLDPNYYLVEMFFACCAFSALILCLWLYKIDFTVYGGVFTKSHSYFSLEDQEIN